MKIAGALAGVILAVGLTGCANAGSEMATEAEAISKKMCACADQACADGVAKEVNDWNTKAKGKKMGKKTIARIKEAEKAAAKCGEEKGSTEAAKVDDVAPEIVEEGEE